MCNCPACGVGLLIPHRRGFHEENVWRCFRCGWVLHELSGRRKIAIVNPLRYNAPRNFVAPKFLCPLCDQRDVVLKYPFGYYTDSGQAMPDNKHSVPLWWSVQCECGHCGATFNRCSCPRCKSWSVVESLKRLNPVSDGRSYGNWQEQRCCAACGYSWLFNTGWSD